MEKTPTFQIQSFGPYYLLERIAVGGMAEIFKAKHEGVRGFEKIVVIKKILHHLSEDPEFVEMFEDEARIAAQLTQANIVQIFELGEIEQTLYITMEYVDGKNLRDITRGVSLKHLHLGLDQCVFIIAEVLKGLDYAHRKTNSHGVPLEIVHRDMSPQNIIVSYEGEVKILDFGIAKAASKLSRTEAGVLKGKFSYMSPEQASGKILDQRSDIYACGVIAHELLTSDRLFRAKTDMETLERVKEGYVEPPSLKNSQVPRALDEIILKALAKDPKDRFQTAGEFLNEISKFANNTGYTYSSQDLGAFMKTLFSANIADEAQRLNAALARVPKNATEQILNAKTRVAFKQKAPIAAENNKIDTPESRDATFTVSKKVVSPYRRILGQKALWIFLIIAGASTLFLKPKKPHPDFIEPIISESPSKPPTESPTAQTNAVTFPEPRIVDTPGTHPQELVTESKPTAQTSRTTAKVDRIFKPLEPNPSPVVTASPAPPPKPSPSSSPAPRKLPPPKLGQGKIHVLPPPDGFAELFIDGKSFGTVPGPKARGILLMEGSHKIICQTKAHKYEGEITIEADSEQTISCGDLEE